LINTGIGLLVTKLDKLCQHFTTPCAAVSEDVVEWLAKRRQICPQASKSLAKRGPR